MTSHEQGTWKSERINGELYHLNVTTDDALKGISKSFKDFIRDEQDGVMDSSSPEKFVQHTGGLDFQTLFAQSIRALKCSECGHLIRISRLP